MHACRTFKQAELSISEGGLALVGTYMRFPFSVLSVDKNCRISGVVKSLSPIDDGEYAEEEVDPDDEEDSARCGLARSSSAESDDESEDTNDPAVCREFLACLRLRAFEEDEDLDLDRFDFPAFAAAEDEVAVPCTVASAGRDESHG